MKEAMLSFTHFVGGAINELSDLPGKDKGCIGKNFKASYKKWVSIVIIASSPFVDLIPAWVLQIAKVFL